MIDWSAAVTQIAEHRHRRPRRSGAGRLSVDAPADLDDQLARVEPLPAWIRLPVVAVIVGGLWTALIAGGVALLSR